MQILFLGDNSDNLLGLLLEGLLKDALDGKRKQQDATEKQQNAEPRPATPSAATARPQEKKEYSLRDLVERQDGAGVNKFLDERPYMVRIIVFFMFSCRYVSCIEKKANSE